MLSSKVFTFVLISILVFSTPALAQNGETQKTLQQILEILKKVVELLTQLISASPTVPRGAYGYVMVDPTGAAFNGPNLYAGDYAASADIGACGKYQTLSGMTVTIKKKDGSYCKEVPVNVCRIVQGTSHPFYQTNELLPWSQKPDYTISLNLPDGWTWAESKAHQNIFPRDVIVGTSGSLPFSFVIKQGGPTPAHILCDGQVIPTTSTTTTTRPPTTTTTIATTTTTGATTTTTAPMPDLEITPADVSDAVYDTATNYFRVNVTIRNKGIQDSGIFNLTYLPYSSPPAGSGLSSQLVNNLAAGSQIIIPLNDLLKNIGYASITKNFMLNVSVDFQNQVAESNENNNFVSKNITVVTTPTTTTTGATTTTSSTTTTLISTSAKGGCIVGNSSFGEINLPASDTGHSSNGVYSKKEIVTFNFSKSNYPTGPPQWAREILYQQCTREIFGTLMKNYCSLTEEGAEWSFIIWDKDGSVWNFGVCPNNSTWVWSTENCGQRQYC